MPKGAGPLCVLLTKLSQTSKILSVGVGRRKLKGPDMSNYKNTGMSLKEIKALEADLFSQCESAQAHKRAAENAGHADEAARWDTILQNTWSELKEWQAYTAR